MAKTEVDWNRLAAVAWAARTNAFVYEGTKVGAAVLASDGNVYGGCNIEQRYRNKDIHAEMSAISQMVVSGGKLIEAIVVVADRQRFTPCGCCMDWIFQFGSPDTPIAFQRTPGEAVSIYLAREIMPVYPE